MRFHLKRMVSWLQNVREVKWKVLYPMGSWSEEVGKITTVKSELSNDIHHICIFLYPFCLIK